jgi:hypothetical protein
VLGRQPGIGSEVQAAGRLTSSLRETDLSGLGKPTHRDNKERPTILEVERVENNYNNPEVITVRAENPLRATKQSPALLGDDGKEWVAGLSKLLSAHQAYTHQTH